MPQITRHRKPSEHSDRASPRISLRSHTKKARRNGKRQARHLASRLFPIPLPKSVKKHHEVDAKVPPRRALTQDMSPLKVSPHPGYVTPQDHRIMSFHDLPTKLLLHGRLRRDRSILRLGYLPRRTMMASATAPRPMPSHTAFDLFAYKSGPARGSLVKTLHLLSRERAAHG